MPKKQTLKDFHAISLPGSAVYAGKPGPFAGF
jgi:hypothetical protein